MVGREIYREEGRGREAGGVGVARWTWNDDMEMFLRGIWEGVV
jgi:hypothetical protein